MTQCTQRQTGIASDDWAGRLTALLVRAIPERYVATIVLPQIVQDASCRFETVDT